MDDAPPAACRARGSPSTRSPARSRSTAAVLLRPGKAASISGTAAAAAWRRGREPSASASCTGTPSVGEHGRGGGLAHADRAGQAEHDHRARGVQIGQGAHRARTSTSGGGGRPKKASKEGTAWPISMASPSTVGRPRALRPRQQRRLQRPIDHVHHHRRLGARGKIEVAVGWPPRPKLVALISSVRIVQSGAASSSRGRLDARTRASAPPPAARLCQRAVDDARCAPRRPAQRRGRAPGRAARAEQHHPRAESDRIRRLALQGATAGPRRRCCRLELFRPAANSRKLAAPQVVGARSASSAQARACSLNGKVTFRPTTTPPLRAFDKPLEAVAGRREGR